MTKALARSVAAAALAAASLLPITALAQSADARTSLDREETEVLGIINRYRAQRGLGPLVAASRLNAVAHDHSQDMASRGYFSHDTPDGRSPFDRMRDAGYPGGYMGENLAAGHADAAATFEQWRTSPGHNAAMLNPNYRAIGLGRVHAAGARYRYYWTSVFGDVIEGGQARAPAAPATPSAPTAPSAPMEPPPEAYEGDDESDVGYGGDDERSDEEAQPAQPAQPAATRPVPVVPIQVTPPAQPRVVTRAPTTATSRRPALPPRMQPPPGWDMEAALEDPWTALEQLLGEAGFSSAIGDVQRAIRSGARRVRVHTPDGRHYVLEVVPGARIRAPYRAR